MPERRDVDQPESGRRHLIDDCPQNPTFTAINKTLDRWDKRMDRQDDLMDRQTVAMETIAEQGATVASHGLRLAELATRDIKREEDLDEAFKSIRKIDMRHAAEDGEEKAEEKQRGKWKQFEDRVGPFILPASMALCFLIWVGDKFSWFVKFVALLKEFKG